MSHWGKSQSLDGLARSASSGGCKTPPVKHSNRSPWTRPSCEIEIEAGNWRIRIRGVSHEFAEGILRDWLK